MLKLSHWCLTNTHPAMYDHESVTTIEMTAKLYGAMNQLIEEYNGFVDALETSFEEFKKAHDGDDELFRVGMRQKFQDFIDIVDLKTKELELHMKTNLKQTAETMLKEIIDEMESTINEFQKLQSDLRKEVTENTASVKLQLATVSKTLTTVNEMLAEQNEKLDAAISYMQTNLQESINNKIFEMIQEGTLVIGLAYTEETETLNFAAKNITYDSDLLLSYDATSETILIKQQEV